uniref:Phosphoglycerate mutase family protein n=1 Tax=uncultured marine group II/III euryarchaeote KM3_27_D07 TaxID=1456429 RepID=A0A075H2M4_9EURY|nr:hypothetical protein [uncultured marine group II/III euryarchaeote KM3_27_D07]
MGAPIKMSGDVSVSTPPVQDFPSLVLQLQATLNAGNENKNSQRVGVLVFRHSDRPDEHNDETHITEDGKIRIEEYKGILTSHGLDIDSDFVFSSPVIRCVQTAALMASIDESNVQKVRWVQGSPWNRPNEDEDAACRVKWEDMKSKLGWSESRRDWLAGGDAAEGLRDARASGKINFDSIFTNVLQPLALKQAREKTSSVNTAQSVKSENETHTIAVCCTHDICILGLATNFQSSDIFIPFLGGLFICFDFNSENVFMKGRNEMSIRRGES